MDGEISVDGMAAGAQLGDGAGNGTLGVGRLLAQVDT